MINVRLANSDDFRSIREFDPHSEYIDPNKLKTKITSKEVLIAKMETKIVGFLKFSYFWMTRPYIDLIFVSSKHRKKGISNLLLNYLEAYLVNEGYAYLFSSSEEKDINAQNWHTHMGFNKMGELSDLNKPHDGTAEIFYSKKISDHKNLKKYNIL